MYLRIVAFQRCIETVGVCYYRTVVLKLVSLVVLVYTIYDSVNCSPKDECNVSTGDCSELRVRRRFSVSPPF